MNNFAINLQLRPKVCIGKDTSEEKNNVLNLNLFV